MLFRPLLIFALCLPGVLAASAKYEGCASGTASHAPKAIATGLHRLENAYVSLDRTPIASVSHFLEKHGLTANLADAPINSRDTTSPRTIRWLKRQIDTAFASLLTTALSAADSSLTIDGFAADGNDGPLFWVSGVHDQKPLPPGTLMATLTQLTANAISTDHYLELLSKLEAAGVGPKFIGLTTIPRTLVRGILYAGMEGYCASENCPAAWHNAETVARLQQGLMTIRSFPWEPSVMGAHLWRDQFGHLVALAPVVHGGDVDQSAYRNRAFDTVDWGWRFERDHREGETPPPVPRKKISERLVEIRRLHRAIARLGRAGTSPEFGSYPASVAIMGELCDYLEDVGTVLITSLADEDSLLTTFTDERRRAIAVAHFETKRGGGERVSVVSDIPHCDYIADRELKQWFYWVENSAPGPERMSPIIFAFFRLYHAVTNEWQIPFHPHFRSLHHPFLK